MDNPLLTKPRSALDFSVVQGMSEHERIVATARMQRAMLLADLVLRASRSTRGRLRRIGNTLFGGLTLHNRGA